MNLDALQTLKDQIKKDFEDLAQDPESVQHGYCQWIDQMITDTINSNLGKLYESMTQIDDELDSLTDFLISHDPKFDVSKLENLFMQTMSVKKTMEMLRDTYGPKS